jgi:hypothetical protein
MNNLAILQALVFEPRKAFGELDARPRFWWPLLLLVISQMVVTFWYMSFVDLEWLVDQQLSSSTFGANMTAEESARVARQAAEQGGMRAVISTVAVAILYPIILLIGALYYMLATKITGVERSFRHWFSLSCWATIPVVLALIPAAIVLLTASGNQIPQEALQPLSFNELLFHRSPGDPGYALFANMNLFQVASVYLGAMGVKTWSGRSWVYAIVITALPAVLIYGIWAFFALR